MLIKNAKNNISEYSKLMRLNDKTPPSNNFIYCSYLFYQCDEIIRELILKKKWWM